jgi:hypothetical protein
MRKKKIPKTLKAGQYIRRQFTFLPGQLDMVVKVAEEMNLSQNAAARWLIDVGLRAYVDGKRPEVQVIEIRLEPRLENWSTRK